MPVPALIDVDIFRGAQEQLKTNRVFSRRNLQREDEYLLRCLVSCGVCGRSMVAHSRGEHAYYHCSANVDHVFAGRSRRCPAPMVYAPDLDLLVWQEIDSLLRSPQLMRKAWEQQRRHNGLRSPDVVEAALERLDESIHNGERQIQRLLDAYQAGLLSVAELGKRRAHAEEQIQSGTEERSRLEADKPKWREAKAVSENLSRFCEHAASGLARLGFDEKQRLLRKIIERVLVAGGEVTVKLTIPLSTNSDLTPLGAHHPAAAAAAGPLAPPDHLAPSSRATHTRRGSNRLSVLSGSGPAGTAPAGPGRRHSCPEVVHERLQEGIGRSAHSESLGAPP